MVNMIHIYILVDKDAMKIVTIQYNTINFINLRPIHEIRDAVNIQTYIFKKACHIVQTG